MKTTSLLLSGAIVALVSTGCGSLPASPLSARARTRNPESPWFHEGIGRGWRRDIILGAEAEPDYPGSDQVSLEPELSLRGTWVDGPGDRYWIGLGGLGAAIDLNDDVTLTAELEYEPGREGGEGALRGFDDVDSTIELQVGLWKRFGPWTLGAVVQPDLLGRVKGNVAFIGGGYDRMLTENLRFASSVDVSWGDNKHHDVEFGIGPDNAPGSSLPRYDPAGGLKSASGRIALEYFFSDRWSLLTGAEAEYYFDEASDSPLIQGEGNDLTIGGSLGVRFSF